VNLSSSFKESAWNTLNWTCLFVRVCVCLWCNFHLEIDSKFHKWFQRNNKLNLTFWSRKTYCNNQFYLAYNFTVYETIFWCECDKNVTPVTGYMLNLSRFLSLFSLHVLKFWEKISWFSLSTLTDFLLVYGVNI